MYLVEYPKLKIEINERIQEIEHSYKTSDQNSWIVAKGGERTFETERIVLTKDEDDRLRILYAKYLAITKCYSDSNSDTKKLIDEFYFKEKPQYSFDWYAENKLFINRKKASDLINDFIDRLELELFKK